MRKEPDLRRTIDRDIAPHEIFISFVDDEDAVNFYEWWYEEGLKIFQEWCDKNES